MSTTIHDRVRIIKNEQELDTTGGGDFSVPPHGETHGKAASDPIPQEIDGITADMTGIADGQVPAYDLASGKFLPGSGGGGAPDPHAPTHAKGGSDPIDQAIDGIPVNTAGIADTQVIRYNSTSGEFEPGDALDSPLDYLDFTDGLAAPAQLEGRVFYDDDKKCLAYYNDRTDVTHQIGRESWVRAYNNTGQTITNGQVVYVSGAITGDMPTIALAAANQYDKNSVLAIATEDILDGTDGECTRFGLVNDFDTSGFSASDILYLAKGTEPTELMVDGDCEKVGTADWAAIGTSTVLTKQTLDPSEGLRNLRVTSTDGAAGLKAARQLVVTDGKLYRLRGMYRSDGVVIPTISVGGVVTNFTGTITTTWTSFDFEVVCNGTFGLFFGNTTTAGYTEWDAIELHEPVEKLLDGDCEETLPSPNWTAGNSALLSKSTADPQSGLRALRITENGGTSPYARQTVITILTTGVEYTLSGYARGDGANTPAIYDSGGPLLWTGTVSTSWQYFEVTFTLVGSHTQFYSLSASGSGGWAEFDSMSTRKSDEFLPGRITNVRGDYPTRPVVVGYCLSSDSITGSMLVIIEPDDYQFEFEGTVIQRQDTSVVESGGTVYMDVELLNGGDLPVQLVGDVHLLDCTTSGPARVALTAGTDTTPQINFIYVELVSGVATLKSSVTAPTGAFAFVAFVSLWSAAKTATDGPALHQRNTDAKAHDGRGRIAYIGDKLRQLGATWSAGVAPTATITTQGGSLDNLDIEVTAGLVWQLHPQVFPALDSTVDGIYVANASGTGTLTNYQKLTDLNQCLEYSDGSAVSNLDRFNLVVWGAVNKNSGECKLFVNLSSGGYATDANGYNDASNLAVTTVDRALFSVAFLICRIPVTYKTTGSGTLEFINPAGQDEIISLLGTPLGQGAGGAGGGGGATILNDLTDVTITTPADREILEYNSTSGDWENVEGQIAEKFFETAIEELQATGDKLSPQLMDDANCEASGVTNWTVSGSATLTKNNSTPPGGGVQSLKIAYNAVANPRAQQDKASSGLTEYILTFWARGDGTNAGSYGNGATTLGTIAAATDWVPYFKRFTGGSQTVWFEAASVASAYIQIDNVFLFEIRDDISVTDELYIARYRENLLKDSENFDSVTSVWGNSGCTINKTAGLLSPLIDRDTKLPVEYQAIVCTSGAATVHYINQTPTGLVLGGIYVASIFVRPGTYGFLVFLLTDTPNVQVYVDLETGEIGSSTGGFRDIKFIKLPSGDRHISVEFQVTANPVAQLRLYVATALGVASFVGDDKDGVYLTGIQLSEGTLGDNLSYIKTTTTAGTGQQDFLLEAETPKEQQVKQGTLERVVNAQPSGIFETPQNDVLYVAPDHMQHLGNGNRVYCQTVFGVGVSGNVTTTVAENAAVDVPVAIHGWCQDPGEGGGPIWYQMGYYASSVLFARGKIESDELIIERGTGLNGVLDPYHVVFYFTINENENGV